MGNPTINVRYDSTKADVSSTFDAQDNYTLTLNIKMKNGAILTTIEMTCNAGQKHTENIQEGGTYRYVTSGHNECSVIYIVLSFREPVGGIPYGCNIDVGYYGFDKNKFFGLGDSPPENELIFFGRLNSQTSEGTVVTLRPSVYDSKKWLVSNSGWRDYLDLYGWHYFYNSTSISYRVVNVVPSQRIINYRYVSLGFVPNVYEYRIIFCPPGDAIFHSYGLENAIDIDYVVGAASAEDDNLVLKQKVNDNGVIVKESNVNWPGFILYAFEGANITIPIKFSHPGWSIFKVDGGNLATLDGDSIKINVVGGDDKAFASQSYPTGGVHRDIIVALVNDHLACRVNPAYYENGFLLYETSGRLTYPKCTHEQH